MITTTHGDMDEAELIRVDGGIDNDNETTTWVEYWMKVEQSCSVEGHDLSISGQAAIEAGLPSGAPIYERVHRSVHVTLKQVPGLEPQLGGFGG